MGRNAVLLAVAALALSAKAEATRWDFRTPDDAAYCRTEATMTVFALRCMTPSTGYWVRLMAPIRGGAPVRVEAGSDVVHNSIFRRSTHGGRPDRGTSVSRPAHRWHDAPVSSTTIIIA